MVSLPQRYKLSVFRLWLTLLCAFTFVNCKVGRAQSNGLDSLKVVLDTLSKKDERYLETLWQSVSAATRLDKDQATQYAYEAYKLSRLNFPKRQYEAATILAQRLGYHNLLDSAESVLDNSMLEMRRSNEIDSFALIKYYDIKGFIAKKRNKVQEAVSYYDSSLNAATVKRQWGYASSALSSLGTLYSYNSKPEMALSYYNRALVLEKKHGRETRLGGIYSNIGICYSKMANYSLSDQYSDSAVWIKEKFGSIRSLVIDYGNLVLRASSRTRNFPRAELYLKKLEGIEASITDPEYRSFIAYAKSTYYLETNDLQPAWKYALVAYQLARDNQLGEDLSNAYENIIKCSLARKDFESAYLYLSEQNALNDSINKIDQEKTLLELETRYGTEKKEAENLRLLQINAQQATLNRVLGTSGGSLAVLLVALGYIYYRQNKQKRVIEAQSAELRQLNDMKSEFFASISHELRTPLTLAKGNIETTVREKHLMAEDEHKLNNARRNLTQLSEMIDDLLDLSKLELGRYNLKLQPVLIRQFLSRTVSSFQSLSEDKKIALIFEDKLNGDRYAQIDTRQFGKVVNNLIYNAFKFSSENDTITIVLQEREGMLKVTVSDKGIGIPPKDLPHIFDRFYQGDNKVEEQGSGLGLAIAKEITVMHGGTLEAKSIERVGTELILSLPLTEAKDEVTHAEQVFDLTDAVGEKLRAFSVEKPALLVVEDNRQMQEYLREILAKYFSVTVKSNGIECMTWLKENSPVLIISDVMMPEMDGFELLSALKQSAEYRNIPVILLTAKSGYDDRLKGLRLGVDDYITKPFDQDELLIKSVNLVNNLQNRIKWTREIGAETMKMEPFSQADELLVSALEEYIKGRISDPKISVAELANLVSMSERQLYRRLAGINGMSPAQLIMEVRLQYARTLLLNGGIVKLSQLAMEVGIGTPAYLSKMFYERFGKRPTEFI
jgi:signal transduction histidine kinase/DNA-binding response OmpR family regulator/uncharacterized protein (DUF934 family)